jgi:hypothetical protein
LVRQIKPTFLEALNLALAVYPEAWADTTKEGIVLHPSPPAVAKADAHRLGVADCGDSADAPASLAGHGGHAGVIGSDAIPPGAVTGVASANAERNRGEPPDLPWVPARQWSVWQGW